MFVMVCAVRGKISSSANGAATTGFLWRCCGKLYTWYSG